MVRVLLATLASALLLATGCTHAAPPSLLTQTVRRDHPGARPRTTTSVADQRRLVVERARQLCAGQPLAAEGLQFSNDPVGFVRAAFWAAHIELFDQTVAQDANAHGMEILYRSAARRGCLHQALPGPGDLIFWDTDPRGNALYPGQVGIVEQLASDGTVTAIGLFAQGPARVRMNLRQPDAARADGGAHFNDYLADDNRVTLAQLFRNFANPFGR